jgi:hypothetical protein
VTSSTPAPVANVLSVDDLAANRAGRLADNQRLAWVGIQRASTSGFRLAALAFAGIGVATLLGVGGGIDSLTNLVGTVGCFAVAAVLGWVSIVPGRRLARDLADGRVETVEGPIERRRADRSYGTSGGRHFLYVGGRGYEVTRSQYEEAPTIGPVRLYALPRTHKVVTLEPGGGEARAADGGVAAFVGGHGDGRAIESAIVGTWRGEGIRATFSVDGSAGAQLPNGMDLVGRWSVDGDGRLHVTVFGDDTAAEAVVDGDTLEIRMDGVRMLFRREA